MRKLAKPEVKAHKKTGKGLRFSAWLNNTRCNVEKISFALFGDVECVSRERTKCNGAKLG